MFGTYRTLLALMVVSLHLGGVPILGAYAVFGFYILSGYLMTFIMQENYGYDRTGLAKYALNRFLRIYPIYWLSCLISLILIIHYGQDVASAFHPAISMPEDWRGGLRNLLLFFPDMEGSRLTPPAWALTVEIFFYVSIGLGISRSRRITGYWFIASMLYTIYANVAAIGWEQRYFSILAASLPFSTGAMIFHYRTKLKQLSGELISGSNAPLYVFTVIGLNWWVGIIIDTQKGVSFYMNYLLCALMVVVLFDRRELPLISRKIDKIMGDFSYPIYLIHYQVGLVMMVWLNQVGFNLHRPHLVLGLLSLPGIFLVAWVMTVTVEKPIELVRSRIKVKKPVVDVTSEVAEKNVV